MAELKIERHRYDRRSVIPHITARNIKFDGAQFYIHAPFADDADCVIYFETNSSRVDDTLLETARALMSKIGSIDNLVQESCAAECARTGLHPENCASILAYVTLSADKARLRYFGAVVNTEWDELAELRNGNWEYIAGE